MRTQMKHSLETLRRTDFDRPIPGIKQRVFEELGSVSSSVDLRDTIVIAGTARSGSTWLGEVLRTLEGYKFLNEPFMNTPLETRTYLGPDEEAPDVLRRYVEDVLNGRLYRSWRWRFQGETVLEKGYEFFTQQKVVVKFTRALRMVRWIDRHFSVRGTLLLIRHPCAVVSSMLRMGRWGHFTADHVLGRNLPASLRERFETQIRAADQQCEILAHLWALDYHLALSGAEAASWILVPYERILTEEREELRRVERELEVEFPDGVEDVLSKASSSASRDLRTDQIEYQLSKWRRHLSEKQIDRILSVTHSYGLGMYTRDLEPRYRSLHSL